MNEIIETEKRHFRRLRLTRSLAWAAGVLFVIGISLAVGMYAFLHSIYEPLSGVDAPSGPKKRERIQILFLGVDGPESGANVVKRPDSEGGGKETYTRSDTLIVASIDPATGKVGLLSIPRDSRVRIPGRNSPEKITHAHFYGGPSLAVRTIEELLGIPIQYYVRTDFRGFAGMIDTIGGVEFDVPQRMYKVDPYQDLRIDLQPGRQLLDGKKAIQLVRFREYRDGDIGRVRIQQAFIRAALDRLVRPANIPKIPSLVAQVSRYVKTNVPPQEMLRLAKLAGRVNPGGIEMNILPGTPVWIEEHGVNVSYWEPDPEGLREAVMELTRDDADTPAGPVTVKVLNGSGVPGAAGVLARALERKGFEVVEVANAVQDDYDTTLVLARGSDPSAAEQLLKAVTEMGARARLGRTEKKDGSAQVTVIIGRDFPRELKSD